MVKAYLGHAQDEGREKGQHYDGDCKITQKTDMRCAER